MREALETQYENELNYIRRMALEFARDRPKIADRLYLDRETGESEDPHVERMIEAFAFLTARIRLKLEDDFPEITDALLGTLYPHYLAPVPSMSIVQFDLDPAQGQLTTGFTIPRHSRLYSREVGGVPCRFRTCYDVTLWPLELISARYHTAPFGKIVKPPARSADCPAVLRLEFRCRGSVPLAQLQLDRLRLFLSGDDLTVRTLYELIFNHVTNVLCRASETPDDPAAVVQDAGCLQPVGFGRDEGLLPYSHRSFLGYRLLTEYFTFPSKFQFVDVCGLEKITSDRYRDRLEICLFLDRNVPELETRTQDRDVSAGLLPDHQSVHAGGRSHPAVASEIRIPGDSRCAAPTCHGSLLGRRRPEHEPGYARNNRIPTVLFVSTRPRGPTGSRVLARPPAPVVAQGRSRDRCIPVAGRRQLQPQLPAAEVLTLETTCSNRELPGQLRAAGGESWQFQLEGQAPVRRVVPVVVTHLARPITARGKPLAADFAPGPESSLDRRPRRWRRSVAGDPQAVRLCPYEGQQPAHCGHPEREQSAERGSHPRRCRLRILSRLGGHNSIRRRQIRRQRRVPVCRRAGTLSGTVRLAEFGHASGRPHASAGRGTQTLAVPLRGQNNRITFRKMNKPAATDDAWSTGPPLDVVLRTEPYRFEFFQAVRILERLFQHSVGTDANPEDEVVRFRAHQSLLFPPSEIYDIVDADRTAGFP